MARTFCQQWAIFGICFHIGTIWMPNLLFLWDTQEREINYFVIMTFLKSKQDSLSPLINFPISHLYFPSNISINSLSLSHTHTHTHTYFISLSSHLFFIFDFSAKIYVFTVAIFHQNLNKMSKLVSHLSFLRSLLSFLYYIWFSSQDIYVYYGNTSLKLGRNE